jgi:YHS domain-containing protein
MHPRVVLLCLSLLAPACGSAPSHTSQPATASDKILVNVDDRGVGLGGNDPVSYRTAVAAGTDQHASKFGGATYQFASADNKAAFDAAPAANAPAYGGYCAFAASQNRLSPSDPSVFLVHDGQLLVFTNEDFRTQFQQDPGGNKAKADANWPGLVAKHGK